MNERTIPVGESMTVEFKSDRGPLSDKDLILAVVCMANAEGGTVYLGMEDDGEITGVAPVHESSVAEKIAVHTGAEECLPITQ